MLRLSTRGHCSLESFLSDDWRKLLVLQGAEERSRRTHHHTLFCHNLAPVELVAYYASFNVKSQTLERSRNDGTNNGMA